MTATVARKPWWFALREPTALEGQTDDDHAADHEEHEDAGGTGHVKNSVVDLVSGERSAVVQSL